MGEWQDLPLAIGEGRSRSSFESAAELDNLMLVKNPPGSLRPFMIANTPGFSNPVGSGSGDMRAAAVVQTSGGSIAHVWYVRDTHLWAHNSLETVDLGALTGITSGSSACKIVPVGLDRAVVVAPGDGKAWYVSTNYVSTTITTLALPAGSFGDAAYQDGYTVYTRAGTDEWYISALDDPTTISALDFTTIDAAPDWTNGVISVNRELLVFGREHVEFYYNSGNASFPFTRQQPGVTYPGTYDPATLAQLNGIVYYLGTDRRVYQIRNYTAEPISTEWVEALMSGSFGVPYGSTYVDKGQRFYALSLGLAGMLVYDIDSGLWHTRTHLLSNNITPSSHAGIVNNEGLTWVAANAVAGSDLYKYDTATFRDSGNSVDMLRTMCLPSFEASGRPVFESAVRLDMERTTGVTGTVQFDYADESASSFITHGGFNSSPNGNAGTSLATDQAMITWNRCGRYRRRRHKFRILANARIAINAVQHKYELGI